MIYIFCQYSRCFNKKDYQNWYEQIPGARINFNSIAGLIDIKIKKIIKY
jgi:hypothetical protein